MLIIALCTEIRNIESINDQAQEKARGKKSTRAPKFWRQNKNSLCVFNKSLNKSRVTVMLKYNFNLLNLLYKHIFIFFQ